MEHLVLQPGKVRMGGNILEARSVSDYTGGAHSSITSGTATINLKEENVFVLKNAPGVDTITLTADKTILSAADEESATLTATVLDEYDNPIPDVTVDVLLENVVFSSGTTNSDGEFTCTYTATGAGEKSFVANVGGMYGKYSSIIPISDCYLYYPLTSDKSRYSKTSGAGTFTYGSNGLTVTGTTNSDTYYESSNTYLPEEGYTLEVTTNISDRANMTEFGLEDIFINLGTDDKMHVFKRSTNRTTSSIRNVPYQVGDKYKFEVTGTTSKTIKIYLNTTLVGTVNNINRTRKQFFKTYNNRTSTYKDLKIY